ncbi:hypothetical protein AMAG_18120 [Allomyces macrogynus ATCC 38327]|uniref:Uncharacterized protein n=1 Tax=Allomyces macrogynus (strain ATCC 38327) TaxID=578462 RepID=A0A0L0S9X1_ALLM3|nr:hypothetical protein AMAG_18120 [Allomyces macrogynus ATCC 38327]|eukprot:KNE59190.1 hypothetical protein AMAG_18120 [Allomyces macrogynus ATCC 38327]
MPHTRSATATQLLPRRPLQPRKPLRPSSSPPHAPDALVPPTPVPTPGTSPAAAPKPAAVRHTIDVLPADVLALILSQMVATDSLSALLHAQLNALYKCTLEQWGVNTEINPRARKIKTFFAVLMRELQNGRCVTCARGKLDSTIDPFGGRCREC